MSVRFNESMNDDPRWPKAHPGTGEPLVSGTVQTLKPGQPVYGMPLLYPRRTVVLEYDDDGNAVESYERTDAELEVAIAAHHASPTKEGGLLGHASGQETTHGSFETESGATCEGYYDGKAWEWTAWNACSSGARR